jgi:3-hydroxy-9,10-secoandrosta-1,3,5(10)-triene-9,17-dione monooxygenase reductase component
MTTIVDRPAAASQGTDFDTDEFRSVMSHFASGVVVITGMDGNEPVGMTAQSFVSLSMDPPLILVSPAKTSTSWPRIGSGGKFAVNILGQDHRHLAGAFARSGTDKFAGVDWHLGELGTPVLDDAIAAIGCDLDAVHPGGDHWIVTGRVRTLYSRGDSAEPLVFFRAKYRSLTEPEQA